MRTPRFLSLFACLACLPALAADWPMLGRDATRNGVSTETGIPARWQLESKENGVLLQPAWNIKWQAELGSSNFAPPIVANGLVWVGTNKSRNWDRKEEKDAAVLLCFREADGKLLWRYVSPRLDNQEQDWPGAGINCSPLAEGDRLYFTTNRAEVICLDVGPLRQGKGEPRALWKLDMRKELNVSPVGAAMNIGFTCSISSSYRGRIYVTTGNGTGMSKETVPDPKAPSLLCLDRDTGKVLWSDNSPGKNILYSQWSSPLVIEVKGRVQVVAAQGDGWVRSFDALTGELVWKFDTNPKAAVWKWRGQGTRNYLPATPVFHDNRVYIANGQALYDDAGEGHLWCIDPAKEPKNKEKDLSPLQDNFDPAAKVNKDSGLVWHYGGPITPKPAKGRDYVFGRTMSNVAIHQGLLLATEAEGYVHCLDARTGKHFWVYDAKDAVVASPLIVDDKVYVPTEGGQVLVLALSREKKLLAKNDVEQTCCSSPVVANGVLYVATLWQLLAIKADSGDAKTADRAPGHWPQWRGPDRSNVSSETELLKKWPAEGPSLAWKTTGLGEGVTSVAVAGRHVYTLGYLGQDELLTALDETTGKKLWDARLGPAVRENPAMRWLGQRTPTVDDDRVYATTAQGEVICLRSADGKEVWRASYPKDFAGKSGSWGYCDRPLVDGDRLICVPGGAKATVVALNKKTGEVMWKCPVPNATAAGYSATVKVEAGGVVQYVAFPAKGLVGISAHEGKLLWQYDKVYSLTANNYTPLVAPDHVFCASGYGAGIALLKLVGGEERGTVDSVEVYRRKQDLPPWHDGTVLVGKHVYLGTGGEIACLELATGKEVWKDKGAIGGTFSLTCADGHLYLRSRAGKVALVEATPEGYALKGVLSIPNAMPKSGATAPVVAGGRLYLRDEDVLFCYEIKAGAAKQAQSEAIPPKEGTMAPGKTTEPRPEAPGHDIFVPTPQDVVERMLELAGVKKDETVYDLGCGDGRIVVTAARKYGCKAYGCDIDPECMKLSLKNVKKNDVSRLVTIEKQDIFKLDLRGADIVTLYLLPKTNERLLPQLNKLKAGSRIIAHAFEIPGIRPERVETYRSQEDDLEHKIYLYKAPLKTNTAER